MTAPAATRSHDDDESFLSVLLDITKKHPVIFIALFLLPLIALLISLGLKWHYVFSDTTHYLQGFSIDRRHRRADSSRLQPTRNDR